MLINYYITDGKIITSPQVYDGGIEDAKRVAIKDATINFPEYLFGFPIVAVMDVDGDRLVENIS